MMTDTWKGGDGEKWGWGMNLETWFVAVSYFSAMGVLFESRLSIRLAKPYI
jgi:hypothetical protein